MKMKILAAAAVTALLGIAGTAEASTWLLNYSSLTPGGPTSATIEFTTSNTLNAAGAWDITGLVFGNVDGDVLTGMEVNPNQAIPAYAVSASGLFNFDNELFGAVPYFSNNGALFNAASGKQYNVFSELPVGTTVVDGAPTSPLEILVGTHNAFGGATFGASSLSNHFSLTSVPEPATWAMMLVGFGGLGVMLRRNRPRTTYA